MFAPVSALMSISRIAPVIASKPVAKTMASTSKLSAVVRRPSAVMRSRGVVLLRRSFDGALHRRRVAGDTERGGVSGLASLAVLGLVRALPFRVHRAVDCRQDVLRGALEHVEVLRLLGDFRDGLHAGRAG